MQNPEAGSYARPHAPAALAALLFVLLAAVATATTSAQETTPCPPPADPTPDNAEAPAAADCPTPPPEPEPPPTTTPTTPTTPTKPPPRPAPPAPGPQAPAQAPPAREQIPGCAQPSPQPYCRCPDGRVVRKRRGAGKQRGLRACERRAGRPNARSHTRGRARERAAADVRRRRLVRQRRRAKQLERARQLVPISALRGAPLPDPLPPAKRLDARFAGLLKAAARAEHADWAVVLAVLRERGQAGAKPAGKRKLRALARRLAGSGERSERVRALADLNRAIGLKGLVRGLAAVKGRLAQRVLGSQRIKLYWGGRGDVQAGRIEVRVLVTLLYLARRHGAITVTSLIAGHSLYTASGGISLHPFGRAVDIAAVGGVPILGHQQPGGITERTLRSILLLPQELRPSELISLFALGGPSFALSDHADHIHIGY